MAENKVGVVEEMVNKGKAGGGSFIRVGGHKYGAYDPQESGFDSIEVGDSVSFRYNEKPAPGGIVYKNIAGKVTKMKDGLPAAAIGDLAAAPAAPRSGGGFSRGSFPVPITDGSRSIIRQNSITNAVAIVDMIPKTNDNPEDIAVQVVGVARILEAYSSGDMDAEEAEAALAEVA